MREAGFEFIQRDPPYDDAGDPSVHDQTDVRRLAMDLARRKAHSLREDGELPAGPSVILAADTICVTVDGRLIGQPADRDEAEAMIRGFMNGAHDVVTGVCVESLCGSVLYDVARVHVGRIDDHDLQHYLDSGEWRGKAGGYNLFDRQAAGWPVSVEPGDDPTTVVGLPMRLLLPTLNTAIAAAARETAPPPPRTRPRLKGIMSGADRSISAAAARTGLAVLAPAYGAAIAVRNAMFDRGARHPKRLPRTTVSIGNITAGGVGKPPMTIALCRMLQSADHTPAILLRGHGNDETHEYRAALDEGVPVEADPDRTRGAARALAARPDADVFLLDDAFQHRQVARDLDLVLIDGLEPFGFEHLLPRGLLREPVKNLRRADAVIVTRADLLPGDVRRMLDATIESLTGRPPIAHAAHTWHGYTDEHGGEQPLTLFAGRQVLGVCGLGNPRGFEQSLARHALTGSIFTFPDHHAYTAADLYNIFTAANDHGTAIVTTEKDWVKWQPLLQNTPTPAARPPIYRPRMRIEFLTGENAVRMLMRERMRVR